MSFDGRIFLLDSEYATYVRRGPVRYIKKTHSKICVVCGKEAEQGNPLTHAHRIPFSKGVFVFKLTPEFLDRSDNIASAHKKSCNKHAELSDAEIFASIVKAVKENDLNFPDSTSLNALRVSEIHLNLSLVRDTFTK